MSAFYLFLIYGRSGGVTTHFAHHLVRANERFYKHKTENTSEGRNAEQKGYSWPRKDGKGSGGKEGSQQGYADDVKEQIKKAREYDYSQQFDKMDDRDGGDEKDSVDQVDKKEEEVVQKSPIRPAVRNVDPFVRRRRLAEAKQAKAHQEMAERQRLAQPMYEQWEGSRKLTSAKEMRLEREEMLKNGNFAYQPPAKKKLTGPLGDFLKTKFGWTIHQGLNADPQPGSKVSELIQSIQRQKFTWLKQKAKDAQRNPAAFQQRLRNVGFAFIMFSGTVAGISNLITTTFPIYLKYQGMVDAYYYHKLELKQ